MASINNLQSIVFFGNEHLSTGVKAGKAPAFRALLEHDYPIRALILSSRATSSNNKLPIEQLALEYGVPVIKTPNLADEIASIKACQAEIGVLAAFGQMIPPRLLDVFPGGILNIHPSLLPRHRGPTPV